MPLTDWLRQFHERGVAADCHYFSVDPRLCRTDGARMRQYRLPQLLAQHHRATLVFCAEAEICFDSVSGRLHPWVETLHALPTRVLLTPSPPYRWGANEWRLQEAGFIVAPVDDCRPAPARRSARRVATAGAVPGEICARVSPAHRSRDLRWLDRNAPSAETTTALLRQLHDYLGPKGYAWLARARSIRRSPGR